MMKGIRQMLMRMWIKRAKKFHPVFLKIFCAIVAGMKSKEQPRGWLRPVDYIDGKAETD
jgi:hypothetical protein